MDDLEPKNVIKFPAKPPMLVPPIPEPKEHYRVGFDSEGMTTLTLMADGGTTMTLSMNQESCEQLIKMLRATYKETVED